MVIEGIVGSGPRGAVEIFGRLVAVYDDINLGHLASGVKGELRRLPRILELIMAKTSGERNQVNTAEVSLWLKKLKEAAYDADDVLDDFYCKAMRGRSKKNAKVKDLFSSSNFNSIMANKIRDINNQLIHIDIVIEKNQFQSTRESLTSRCKDQTAEKRKRLTTSFFGDESKIVGRKHDKSEIVRMLTSTISSSSSLSSSSLSFDQNEKVSVISIVGMAGVGKTTLAQSVYNSVEKYFTKRIWACVSDNFDFYQILLNIMEYDTNTKCPESPSTDVLVHKVRKELVNERYLLVFDDLWIEDPMVWNELKRLLDVGSVGSKIIVTTRNQKVASVVRGSIPPYNLNVLSEAECWSIIKNNAFSPGGASKTPDMEVLGQQMAKKCGGLPLAATYFGCCMRSQSDETHCLSIRDQGSLATQKIDGTKIISILTSSYNNLSSHMKQCLTYCCLFPKDWEFDRETLIQMWMAEGFLHSSHGGDQILPEDIGNDYFHYLFSNSFFQDVETDELGEIKTFKMHWLVYDFISAISGSEVTILGATKFRSFFSLGNSFLDFNSLSGHKRLRVACLLGVHSLKIPSFTSDFKHLRYLNLSNSKLEEVHTVSVKKLCNLQTLILHRCTNVQIILEDIGFLKLLRHLNLSCSDIHVLPESVNQLSNLQTLDLYRCLQFEALPLDMGSFGHLSRLDISYTAIDKLPSSISAIISLRVLRFMFCGNLKALPEDLGTLSLLRSLNLNGSGIKVLPESCVSSLRNLEIVELGSECQLPKGIKNWPKLRRLTHRRKSYHEMPKGIDRLICLQELKSYMVSKEETNQFSRIEELSSLNNLQVLVIRNLENLRGVEDAAGAKLKYMQNIQLLELRWNGEGMDDSTAVLEGLQPHSNLKTLLIKGFKGLKFPRWMGGLDSKSSCLPNLVELKLQHCNICEQLPSLSLLPCLRILCIDGMMSVKCLGAEFYYQESRVVVEEEVMWKQTTTASSSSLFPALIELRLRDMSSLVEWLPPPAPYSNNSFPSLRSLSISGCLQLRSIPLTSFSSLDSLELSDTNDKVVSSILAVKAGGPGSLITSISIQDSAQLKFFPMWVLQHYTHLRSLEISCCSKFQGFRIQNYSNGNKDDKENLSSDIVFDYTSTNSLHSLKFRDCPVLTYVPDLREWESLTELRIENCDKLKKSLTYDLASIPGLGILYVDRFIDLS